jgi:DNA-binding Lrp family transcriptional regulator
MARDPAPQSSIRVAARLANGFALDLVKLGGFGRDVIDGLLLAAISQANVAQITRSPELQRRYATLDQPPPDEMRRPVSISAIANSLLIPFETVRRRVTALADLGIVKTLPRGVIVPTAPLNSPFYRIGAEANYGLVRTLYVRLRGIGLLEELPRTIAPPFDPEHPPIRLVIRLSSDYLLRLAEPISRHVGDLVTGLVLMDMIHANTQDLPDSEGGEAEGGWAAAGFVPDGLRKGVRPAALSERLGIPNETVRRHIQRLLDDDRCERKEDGFVVPARVLARPPFVRYMVDNQSHLHRLYAGLADFGVLTEWDREILSLRGAA